MPASPTALTKCTGCGVDFRTGYTVDKSARLNEKGLEYLSQIPWSMLMRTLQLGQLKREGRTIIFVSHDTNEIHSTPVDHSHKILLLAQDADVIGIDEAQFFDPQIAEVCDALALKGIRVIVAGLDMDYLGNPFGQMPFLMAKADYVTKLHAICMRCGHIANYSYRKIPNEEQVMLGATDVYEPRCRNCMDK